MSTRDPSSRDPRKPQPNRKPGAKPRAQKPVPGQTTAGARPSDAPAEKSGGERIAKVLSRAGVASRREAERMIEAGRVVVNGKVIDSPALNVTDRDRIEVDNAPLPEAEAPRLWLYYKPTGLVTTNSDEKGRTTIFDELPEDLPRVMTVGRLDLNSEGLLLLTNDGGIKRQLELPSTGWLRRYRVRINGRPKDEDFEPLRKGLVIEGERFQPMQVSLDRQQGANAWVTIGLREGKNREIRRAMEDIGFQVNRLLRISYGPFQLGDLKEGQVEELRSRVVRDQLGLEQPEGDAGGKPHRPTRPGRPGRPQKPGSKPGGKPGTKFGEKTAPYKGGKPSAGGARGTARGTAGGGRPAGKSFGKSSERPSGKPTGRPTGKPTGKSGPRSGPKGRPMGKKQRD
ncbi:pseudouridine synthase [Tritonibacter multivorans]|nr:pseudouridine synthase [Tritonibacter multivorans]MDA7420755.1 pseudouridine synthase [Tritonibacter multivorans]